MTCQRCGHTSPGVSAFCTNCGEAQEAPVAFAATVGGAQPAAQSARESVVFRPPASVARNASPAAYGAFLSRLVAFLVDEIIAGALAAIAYGVMASLAAASSASSFRRGYPRGFGSGAGLGAGFLFLILGAFLALAVYVYYFVKFETGPRQATLGKSLLGLRITTTSGMTISVGQSLGRLIIKNTFSGLFFALGFLMAAFTERKQALHDFIAGTIVVQG